nr:efflux RND transporter periplasmic adaptor subunit [Pseudenhygromyxa sp. WMMC2535]
MRWFIALVIIAALVAAVVLWTSQDHSPPPNWQTVELGRGDIDVTIDATGTLEPEQSVTVGAEISGLVASVEVEEDDRVEAGQLLARFDLESLESQKREAKATQASARADLASAKASLRDAELQLARTRRLNASGVVSSEEVEQSETSHELAVASLARARAQLQLARAALDQIEIQISKAEINAPITGVVLTRDIEPGKTVAASFQTPELFTIAADLQQMKLELPIDEADVGRIQVGQDATFYVDAWPERVFAAKVTKVHLAPETSGNVVTYTAELEVDNSEALLRPGMTATATISVGTERDVLRVPIAALRFSPPEEERAGFGFGPPPMEKKHASGSAIWVLREDELGVAQPVRVAIDAGASDGDWIAVDDDKLSEGELILIGEGEGEGAN